jgi:hypothetical protein
MYNSLVVSYLAYETKYNQHGKLLYYILSIMNKLHSHVMLPFTDNDNEL